MKHKYSVISLLLTLFIDLVGFGILVPILPYTVVEYDGGGSWIGIIISSFSVAQFIGSYIGGKLSDKFGRRVLILVNIFGTIVSYLLTAFSNTLVWIAVSRFLGGLFASSVPIGMAYISDITTNQNRTKYLGYLGAAIGSGFIMGPALGGGLGAISFGENSSWNGLRFASVVAASFCLVNLVYSFIFLKETLKTTTKTNIPKHDHHYHKDKWERINDFEIESQKDFEIEMEIIDDNDNGDDDNDLKIRTLKTKGKKIERYFLGVPVLCFCMSNFFRMFANAAVETVIGIHGSTEFGVEMWVYSLVWAICGLILCLSQLLLVNRLKKSLGEMWMAIFGLAIVAISIFLMAFSMSAIFLFGMMFLFALGCGISTPALLALVSLNVSEKKQGTAMGMFQSAASMARALSPVISGPLYDLELWIPYSCGSSGILLSIFCVAFVCRKKQVINSTKNIIVPKKDESSWNGYGMETQK